MGVTELPILTTTFCRLVPPGPVQVREYDLEVVTLLTVLTSLIAFQVVLLRLLETSPEVELRHVQLMETEELEGTVQELE